MLRKFTTLLSICLIAIPFFTSCGSHVTIKKRLYSSGYYISHGNSKSDATKIDNEESPVINPSKDHSLKLNTKTNEDEMTLSKSQVSTSDRISTSRQKSKIEPLLTTSPVSNIHPVEKERTASKSFNRNVEKGKRSLNHMKDSSDGLSLFWIVILIILILWAIGFIGGSVGSIINLLLVIALILLILWLLRVI